MCMALRGNSCSSRRARKTNALEVILYPSKFQVKHVYTTADKPRTRTSSVTVESRPIYLTASHPPERAVPRGGMLTYSFRKLISVINVKHRRRGNIFGNQRRRTSHPHRPPSLRAGGHQDHRRLTERSRSLYFHILPNAFLLTFW